MQTSTGACGVRVDLRDVMVDQAARRGRVADGRGWGQGVYVPGAGWRWPTGDARRGERFDDSIDDQLRHAIAWHPQSSHAIGRLAGVKPAAMDAFMQGGDTLTLRQAARVARLVGVRLASQATIDGLLAVWERAGRPAIRCPGRNRLVAG